MLFHFDRRKKSEKEKKPPRFLVLRRKWLTLGAAVLAAAAIFAAVNYPAAVSASAAARQLPIYCVQRDQKVCSISFDAAWGADNTQKILDVLKEYGVTCTFFVVGNWADQYPEQAKAIVDSGNFDWTNGNFPEFTEPDQSYHGVVYTRDFGRAAYITKARVQLMRDLGCYPSAQAAFLLNHGLETLHLRMERHCQNAEQVARFLQQHGKVESVNYPTLAEDPYHQLAQKYLPNGCSGVISFSLTGGREAAVRFIDSLKLASLVVHVADVRTLVLHPASSTHRQLTDEQLVAAGIHPGMIRLSVGIEHVDDIIEDLKQALEQA